MFPKVKVVDELARDRNVGVAFVRGRDSDQRVAGALLRDLVRGFAQDNRNRFTRIAIEASAIIVPERYLP